MKTRGKKISDNIIGYGFILPFTIGFTLFQFLPFLSSLVVSMTNLGYLTDLSKLKFVGINNFVKLINDGNFIGSLGRSFYYMLIFVPGVMIISLLMALLINSKIYMRNGIRTALFMPYVSNFVAIAVVWAIMLDVKDGPVNTLLSHLGVENPPLWLIGEKTALPTLVMIVIWQAFGFHMITYLAALQGVPIELYESAKIDGANALKRLIHITVPMVSPTTFFLLISSIIMSFQNFAPIQVLTRGGPGDATITLSINIYQDTFLSYRLGYAASQAVVMFAIIMLITVIQWRGQKKWVNYF